jgi:ABC-type multidrug transport system permease subunit
VVLLFAAHLIFKIQWGALPSVALMAAGTIVSASSFGIFFNSFLKSTKQAGVLFGGVLTVTGMLGMIRVFATNSPGSAVDIVSLLVPQGWAIRGIVQSMHGEAVSTVLVTVLVMLVWSAAFFIIGVLRFNRRYV